MQDVVKLEDVSVHYEGDDAPVVEHISFTVKRGELVVLFGEVGTGKSSLMRAISGLNPAAHGDITLYSSTDSSSGDTDKTDTPSLVATSRTGAGLAAIDGEANLHQRGRFGFVFQTPRLLPWRRVLHNVELGLQRSGMTSDERRSYAHYLLELVGLSDLADQFPHRLSPNQFERLGIARALASDPEVLLMDEPFSAVEPADRRELLERVLAIKERTGITMIFATHRADDAICIADRVFLLGGHPTHILEEHTINLKTPRKVHSAGCLDIAAKLTDRLAELSRTEGR